MQIVYLDPDLPELAYQTPGAAGLDLYAAKNPNGEGWEIPRDGDVIIPCGVKVAIPEGYLGLLLLRSSFGVKRSLQCHPGTIDSDYRGELMVKVFNHHCFDQVIHPGERFAQLLVIPCLQVTLEPVAELPTTERGEQGFGSTNGMTHEKQAAFAATQMADEKPSLVEATLA